MEVIIFLIPLMLLGLIPTVIATKKGHDFGGWWLYGTLLFIVALPHSLIISPIASEIEKRKLSEGMKKCPFCAEVVKQEATVCRYCGRDLPVSENKQITPVEKNENILKENDLPPTVDNSQSAANDLLPFFCQNCGTSYDRTWKICFKCNQALKENPLYKLPEECGFLFRGKDKNGKSKHGTVEAANEKEAAQKLREQGIFVISLKSLKNNLP